MAARDSSHREAMQGIRTTLYKSGRYKGAGTPGVPLDGDAHEYFQSTIDSFFSEFVSAVAKGRGLKEEYLRAEVADGRTFIGEEAVRLGLADEIGSLASVLGTSGGSSASKPNNKPTAMQNPEIEAQVDLEEIQAEDMVAQGEGSDVDEPTVVANPEPVKAEEDSAALQAAIEASTALVAELSAAYARIDTLEEALAAYREKEIVAFVDSEVLASGKALPVARESLLAHARSDFEGFKALFSVISANSSVHMDALPGLGPKATHPTGQKVVDEFIRRRNEAATRKK
jgi:hypothetical protein